MKKFTAVAATLAMMLVAAAPASAQGITFGDDGDDSGRDGERTEQSVDMFQFT